MSLTTALRKGPQALDRVDKDPIVKRPIEVAVQGTGNWVSRAGGIREDLVALHRELLGRGHPGLSVAYVGIEPKDPLSLDPTFETYLFRGDDRADAAELSHRQPDIVLVASPDHAHVDDTLAWLRHKSPPRAILIEKPLSNEAHEARRLRNHLQQLGENAPPVLGIDHYNWYVNAFTGRLQELDRWWNDARPHRLVFRMLETRPIEATRLRSLASGMTFDMGAHLFGILSLFCDLSSCTQVEVGWAGRHVFSDHTPALADRKYFAETAFEVRFTAGLRGQDADLEVVAQLGKAAAVDAKFVQFDGPRDTFARLDFSPPGSDNKYPYGQMFTGRASTGNRKNTIVDPLVRDSRFELSGLDPSAPAETPFRRHGLLVESLATGNFAPWSVLLSVEECTAIVSLLEELREQVLKLPSYAPGRPEWRLTDGTAR